MLNFLVARQLPFSIAYLATFALNSAVYLYGPLFSPVDLSSSLLDPPFMTRMTSVLAAAIVERVFLDPWDPANQLYNAP